MRTAPRATAVMLGLALARASAAAVPEERAVRDLLPEAEAISAKDVILTDEMVARIERLARARVRDRLVTFYTGTRGGAVTGHAVVHTHIVRTKPETFAIAFEPDGRIRKVTVLAFLEPEEYRPPERWLAQLAGKGTGDRLAVGQDLAPITGATLTARGIAEESRWLLRALQAAVLEARP